MKFRTATVSLLPKVLAHNLFLRIRMSVLVTWSGNQISKTATLEAISIQCSTILFSDAGHAILTKEK